MSLFPQRFSAKWRASVIALAPIAAATMTACSDSTAPTRPLASSYVLSTIDEHPVPFIYENGTNPEFPHASRYVTRTIEHVANDTFVVSERLDIIRTTDNEVLGYQCTRRNVEMQRSGRYVIFKYYVRDSSTPTAPSVGGMGGLIQLVVKYDTLTVKGDKLVQVTTAIPGRVSRLVFKPGVVTESCPTE